MSEKEYVAVAQHQCPVCGKREDANELLLHRQMRKVFDRAYPPVTGFELCKEHKQQEAEGFVFLVELRQAPHAGENALQDTWKYRTGNIAAIKREAWERLMDVPVPPKGLAFVEVGVLDNLNSMREPGSEA